MEAFKTFSGIVMPLDRTNVDTDAITPARYLKSIKRTGFASALFGNWRYLPDGSPDPNFVLNLPQYRNASVLLARENFGCGSSREHAPWAIQEYGFKVLIAPDFADIFYNNCFNIGLLPVTLKPEEIDELFAEVESEPGYRLKIDLENGVITAPGGKTYEFTIDPFRRDALLKGLDNIGWTQQFGDMIDQYESNRAATEPWALAVR
jgi:3-isopropylmalate/(R)-2-methylmalate dehydratase small subunit